MVEREATVIAAWEERGDNHITTGITEGFILRFQSHLSFSSAILHDSTIFQAP
jgi:hypothetical protein